jgi:hypothetical protein
MKQPIVARQCHKTAITYKISCRESRKLILDCHGRAEVNGCRKSPELHLAHFPSRLRLDVKRPEELYRFRTPTRVTEILLISDFINPSKRSLLRACILVYGSLIFAWPALCSPHGVCAAVLPFAALAAFVGSLDATRSLRKRWDFFHAGVLLLIYAGLMATCLLTFMAFFPLIIAASLL